MRWPFRWYDLKTVAGMLWAKFVAMFTGRPSMGRSPGWSAVRDAFLAGKRCAVCGRYDNLVAHHVKPYHLFPEHELDVANLMPLCESGPGSLNCHCVVGHCGDWKAYNPNAIEDAATLARILKNIKR